jgi:hypothetical protein
MSLTKLTSELFIDLADVSLITTGEKTESHPDWYSNSYYKTIIIKFKDGRTELLKFDKNDKDALANYENILERINSRVC